jgi:outer membrane protein OmpA-like peptidoglycan-associated protein
VTLAPVLNGTTFAVAVRAVNAVGAGKAAGPIRVATVAWFTDPLSKATWAKLVPVPKHPASYRGPVRATKATMRSADGKVAMSGASLRGRQLQPGQAANLDTLFAFDNATLTATGKAEVKAFVGSLHYVKAITCEGYADFGGISSRETALSTRRAGVVCDLVRRTRRR